MKRNLMIAMAILVALGSLSAPAFAQRPCVPTLNTCPSQDVTTSTIQIGGAGSLSSNGVAFSNPGRLDDGTIAEADLQFTFDRTTGRLTLIAYNRTTTTATLTGIGFNTTSDVTGMSLVSETGALAWTLAYDRDRNDNTVNTHPSLKELKLDGFGRFNVYIANKGIDTGLGGGNPTEILAGQSVTFVIQVTGNIGNLTACSFTSQGSITPPGDKIVTAVGRFQSGQQGGSGWIGPCTGGSLLVSMASTSVTARDREVEVVWQTASEIDNAGFSVLRKDVRTGKVVRLNATLIPAEGSAVSGASYRYVDHKAANGKKYEYMIEDWDTSDFNTIHAPHTAVPNPQNPAVRLLAPAYEATASDGLRLKWESSNRGVATVEFSGDATFAAGSTMKLPVGARAWRTISPAEMDQIRRASKAEGGIYWRVSIRDSRGAISTSATYFLVVE